MRNVLKEDAVPSQFLWRPGLKPNFPLNNQESNTMDETVTSDHLLNVTEIKSEPQPQLMDDKILFELSFPELHGNLDIKTELPMQQDLHENIKGEFSSQEYEVNWESAEQENDSRTPSAEDHDVEQEPPTQDNDLEIESTESIEIEIKIKNGQKIFICSKCRKEFTCKYNVKGHIEAIHYKLKPYSCKKCNKSFTKKSSLTSHLIAFGDGARCPGMPPAKQKAENVEIGSEIYNGRKIYKCCMCEKKFTKKPSAVTHVNVVHYGLKPFKCEYCFKLFSKRSNYLNHREAIHLNVTHTCSHCNKSFSRKSSLTAHLVAHDNIFHNKRKTFPCPKCRRSFTHKTSLNRHIMEKHQSGEMKAESPDSVNEDNLNYYEDIEPAIHNEESSFKCRKCNKQLTTKRSAIAHIKQVCSLTFFNFHNYWRYHVSRGGGVY